MAGSFDLKIFVNCLQEVCAYVRTYVHVLHSQNLEAVAEYVCSKDFHVETENSIFNTV